MNIRHPTKICIPVEQALRDWTGPGCYQQKLDGVFAVREVAGGILIGEDVQGEFTAFDCAEFRGENVLGMGLVDRLMRRDILCRDNSVPTVPTVTHSGDVFLRQILANGGEGVVLKSPWSYGEPMIAAKRSQIHLCTVTAIGPGQSIAVKDSVTGQFRGKVPAKGGAADVLRVGDRVRVEAACLHESGLFREAKLCRQYKISGP